MREPVTTAPRWGSEGRERKAMVILETMVARCGDLDAGGTWLDIGCGSGGIASALAHHVGRIVGIDPEPWSAWASLAEVHAAQPFFPPGWVRWRSVAAAGGNGRCGHMQPGLRARGQSGRTDPQHPSCVEAGWHLLFRRPQPALAYRAARVLALRALVAETRRATPDAVNGVEAGGRVGCVLEIVLAIVVLVRRGRTRVGRCSRGATLGRNGNAQARDACKYRSPYSASGSKIARSVLAWLHLRPA